MLPGPRQKSTNELRARGDRFTNHASRLLKHGDALYWTVFDDALAGIKSSLQSYVMDRADQTQDTQEQARLRTIASGNDMNDVLRECLAFKLDVHELADKIIEYNRARNRRTHDDPSRAMNIETARDAVELAKTVNSRVQAALASTTLASQDVKVEAAAHAVASSAASAVAVDASGHPGQGRSHESSGTALLTEPVDVGANSRRGARSVPPHRILHITKGVAYAAALAVVLAAGTVLGIGVQATGASPSWIQPLTTRLGAATPAASRTASANAAVPAAPAVAGSIGVLALGCSSGAESIQLENVGGTATAWAIAAPDGGSVHFALTPQDAGTTTLFGALQPEATVTVIERGAPVGADIVVTSDDGAASFRAQHC